MLYFGKSWPLRMKDEALKVQNIFINHHFIYTEQNPGGPLAERFFKKMWALNLGFI